MCCLGCFEDHTSILKISTNQVFIPIVLFLVKKVVKKEVLGNGKVGFSLGFWEAFLRRFLGVPNCTISWDKKNLVFLNIGKFGP